MTAMPIFSWSLSFLRPYRTRVMAIVLLALAEVGLAALAPWPMKAIVDNVFGGHPFPGPLATIADTLTRGSLPGLLVLVAMAGLGLQLLLEVVRGAHTQFAVDTGQRIVYDLRARLLTHLQALPLRYHVLGRTADTVYRLESDAYCVNDLVIGGVFPLATAALNLTVMFVILMGLDPTLGLLSLAVAPFLYVSLRYYSPHDDRPRGAGEAAGGDAGGARLRDPVVDCRDQELRARAARAGPLQPGRRRDDEGAAAADVAGVAVLARASRAITLAGTALVLVVGGLHVLQGTLTVGGLLVVIAYLGAVYGPLSAIAHTTGALQQARVSARRVQEMFALTPEALDVEDAVDASGIVGDIVFEDVSFAYDESRQILAGHQLRRPSAARLVALVGLTGAGKTTIASLIPRFFDPTGGRVLIDGVDVSRYRLRSLRERIALVPQEPVLFSGSIGDNIRYGRLDATDEEVAAAAQAAHVDHFIVRLPAGYDTPVAEAGATLSGGERQRLGIARALLKDAPILILDEPTSSLDAISEEAVFQALRKLREGRTTLVIAHRLSTIRDANRILVLHEGQLIAQGTHDELIASNELYARMCARLSVGRSLDEPESVDEILKAGGVKIVLAGIVARYPYGGVTWCSLMYLLGLRDLGHEVCYIEDTGECVYDPVQNALSTDPAYGTDYIHRALEPFGLGDRWSFVNYDGTYHGASRDTVRRWCAEADLFINLSGGSWFWRDEYAAIPRKVFVDSDPVFTQLALAKGDAWYVDFFRRFDRLFTFGANIGTPACDVPTSGFTWHHTWQPVVTELWRTDTPPGDRFTTVMTWRIESFTDVDGNKDREFVRFIDLPSRTPQPVRAGDQRAAAAAPGARLVHRGRDGGVAIAVGLSRLHPAVAGRVRRRQARLRVESLGLVQRSHRVLPGGGPAGAGAGHGLERPPAVGHGADRVLDAGRGDRRPGADRARLRRARAARRRDRPRALRRHAGAAAVPRDRVWLARCASRWWRRSRSRCRRPVRARSRR